MKKILPFLFLLMLAVACSNPAPAGKETAQPAAVAAENALSLEFQVEGMTCTGCENTVNKSIQELPGIAEVKSSFKDSLTTVTFDKTLTKPEELKAAIESKGYKVKGWRVTE